MDVIRLVKKHSALLLPIGITVGAILLFVPALMAGKAVQSQMEESTSLGGSIKSLIQTTPPATQYKVEQAYQQEHAGDANMITLLSEQTSERELLSYGIFPEPNETSSAIFMNFGKTYRKAIEELVGETLHARECPAEAEIAEVTKSGSTGGSSGYNGGSVVAEAGSRNEAIIERLCRDRADSIPVYASPNVFSGYDFWDNYNYIGRNEAIDDCWKAQMAYWIQKDIANTIATMGKDYSSVSKSPVKRLLGISFAKGDMASRQNASGMIDMPRYVLSPTDGALITPFTERISNDTIDVVHFTFTVIVSNNAVLPFMKELCSQKSHVFRGWSGQEPTQNFVHNQITILKSLIEPVNCAGGTRNTIINRYRYGSDSVVQLELVCEYIFDKTGYAKVKPALASGTGAVNPSPQPQAAPSHSSGGGHKQHNKSGITDGF